MIMVLTMTFVEQSLWWRMRSGKKGQKVRDARMRNS